MNTSNPTLRPEVFREAARDAAPTAAPMTIQGTLTKTSILLAAVTVAASFTWQKAMAGANPMPWAIGGLIAGLVLGLVLAFKPTLAPLFALPYALAEGLFLGALSAVYATRYGGAESGLVLQAVLLTFGVAFAMLALYALRIIRVTERLRSTVLVATAGLGLFYLVSFVLSFFMASSPLASITASTSLLSVGFSVFVVGLAAFNLLLDFELVEKGAAGSAPKHMEWYGAFALLVTLVWLYIEILRLLSKLRSRD